MPEKNRSFERVGSLAKQQVTEIAVLVPIRTGRVPGERQTFEQRLRLSIATIERRAAAGIPTPLSRIQSIHFGRLIVIRPEQFLHYSDIDGIPYCNDDPGRRVPCRLDDFRETDMNRANPQTASEAEDKSKPQLRSFLLTIVSFDGELKPYFRDIADFLGRDFDQIFENCEDYDSTRDFETFWAWIRRYQIPVDLFVSAYPDLSVVEIKRLQHFKQQFDAFVARTRGPGKEGTDINPLFDDFLRENQQFASDFPSAGGVYLPDAS